MSGKLSTHILDTYSGCPAAGVAWSLEFSGGDGVWSVLKSGQTNADGRNDGPVLTDDALMTGSYRFIFQIGAYYKSMGVDLPEPAFLDEVILQVNLMNGGSYHVPLLVSPWSYSTYRGS